MGTYTVERYHDISAGHRVHGHESKCAHLHGHNYRFIFVLAARPEVVDAAQLDRIGRVIDFGVIKTRLCHWLEDNWDHRFLVSSEDPMRTPLTLIDKDGVVIVPFNPTAENLAAYFVDVVAPRLLQGTGTVLVSCRVEETRKCSATYYREGYNQ